MIYSASAEETFNQGKQLGSRLAKGGVICFFGDLAAGKTTFIKGLAAGYARIPPEQVSSPTFVLLNIYEGTKPFYHFDLYRLKDSQEFLQLGFEEYLPHASDDSALCCIEWTERIADILPPHAIQVRMKSISEEEREIIIENLP